MALANGRETPYRRAVDVPELKTTKASRRIPRRMPKDDLIVAKQQILRRQEQDGREKTTYHRRVADAPERRAAKPSRRAPRRRDDLDVVAQRTQQRLASRCEEDVPPHRRATDPPGRDSAQASRRAPRQRRLSQDDLGVVDQRTLRRQLVRGGVGGERDASTQAEARGSAKAPRGMQCCRNFSQNDLGVVQHRTRQRQAARGEEGAPPHRRPTDARRPAKGSPCVPRRRRLSQDDLGVVEQRTLRRQAARDGERRATDAPERDPAKAPESGSPRHRMPQRMAKDKGGCVEQQTLRRRSPREGALLCRQAVDRPKREPAKGPRERRLSQDDLGVVEQRTLQRRVACPAKPFTSVFQAKTETGATKTTPFYRAGMRVHYQNAAGVQPAVILDAHLDDLQEPYYTVKLEDGREKQTDNAHIVRMEEEEVESQGNGAAPSQTVAMSGQPGHFKPGYDWRKVLPGQPIPAGLEVRMSFEEGVPTIARIPCLWKLDVYLTTAAAPVRTDRVRIDVERATTIAEVIQKVREVQAGPGNGKHVLSVDGEAWFNTAATVEQAGLFMKKVTLAC